MPQSVAQIYLHIIFSTKHRQPFLTDPSMRSRLHAYMTGICDNLDAPSLMIGGVADHVHILCRLGRTITIADLLRDLKRDSTKWLKQEYPSINEFNWQAGYGAFSVSPSHVDALKAYIANQEEHHRTESFQDELRRICRKYGVELDERYAWD